MDGATLRREGGGRMAISGDRNYGREAAVRWRKIRSPESRFCFCEECQVPVVEVSVEVAGAIGMRPTREERARIVAAGKVAAHAEVWKIFSDRLERRLLDLLRGEVG